METSSVKSLNKSPGRRRFVFKTFYERIDDIDINVYRSLEKVKSEPSENSSFFRDCLIEWRELNTAEDFISLYEEVMPYTQTLPLVLLHKESLISKLLSRLQIKARLSLEPIFRLIAALSRDLLEEFVPLLPRIADSSVSLLESGADRDPEIIEWMFVSWSYIMMYLQKYLINNTVHVLKVTEKLRYYPKEYIQQFMAESVSFVLRNAPDEHLKRGVGKVMLEAVKKPSPCREIGVQALLYHVMTVSSLRLHSKAERVLKLLTNKAAYSIGDNKNQESRTMLKIVKSVFKKSCEMMEPEELKLVWKCLYDEVKECASTGGILHLRCLLSLLISLVKAHNGRKVVDYKPLLELVLLLVRKYITPSGMIKSQDEISLVTDKILKLMLGILNGLDGYNDKSIISECASQWAPIFKLQSSSLLHFIRELLPMEHSLHAFSGDVIRAMDDLMENSEEEVVYLLKSFCEKMQLNVQNEDFVNGASAEALARIYSHLQRIINKATSDITHYDVSCQIDEGKLALLWGAVNCYSHMSVVQANPSLLLDLIDGVDQLVKVKTDSSKKAWESIIGAALSSYSSICHNRSSGVDATEKFLSLAKSYRSSSQVLSAVADHLESKYGSPLEVAGSREFLSEIEDRLDSVVTIFADNLSHSDKEIRISTLKILCHYKLPDREVPSAEQMAVKRRKIEFSHISNVDSTSSNVLQLLLSIETTPISIPTSRCIQRLIYKIQMDLSAGRISDVYMPLVLNGLLGILHNRFSHLWNPALDCLAALINGYFTLVWDNFMSYLERFQLISQSSFGVDHCVNAVSLDKPIGLGDSFKKFVNCASDSTPCVTILSLLLQCLQKVQKVESRSQQFIPLFLKFLGYNIDYLMSVGSFDDHVCKGKEWKVVLKEWLNLLKLMKNSKLTGHSQFLKEVLQNRLMEENDPEIQVKVLDCLLTWKDDYLVPYDQHLRNLISSKNLREELTTWSLSRDAGTIEECHRMHLVPLVIRLLMPKVRMLKELASRKNASIYQRKAILRFIAEVDVCELPIFFALMLKPLHIVNKTDGSAKLFWTLPGGSVSEFQTSSLLEYFTSESIAAISLKKRYAFLHVIEDVLGVLDELHVRPFLDLLMGCVVRVLGSCASSIDNARLNEFPSHQSDSGTNSFSQRAGDIPGDKIQTSTTLKQFKDIRSLCLRIVSFVLNKYEDHEFGYDLWDLFFASVKPLIDRFKQEAASSEKPSSLFSCFLAMSRNNKLVALLCREEGLVSDICSILHVKSASEAVIDCVLKFVDNLLILDNQLDDEDNPPQRVLQSNIVGLVGSLCFLFGSDSAAKRKLVKSPGEMVLNIFKFLPKYIKDADLAKQFVDILLLFIEKKSLTSDACAEVLEIIQNFIPMLGNGCTTKILSAISPLYILAELDMRLRVCDLLDALAASDTSILSVAKLLRQLNATSSMGWLNHDAILEAYESINIDFFREVEADHALLVLSHCVHDMSSKELTFVVSACDSLMSFVDFSALILNKEGNNEGDLSVMRDTAGGWTRSCIQRITSKFLLKHMADAMDGVLSVRKGWIKLLRQMVSKLPEVSNLKSLVALSSEDAEVDFLNNIVDPKLHRRVRALSRFRNIISTNKMSEVIIKKVFLPLFFNMLFDEQEGKAEHMKNACIESIASVAGQMEWKTYYALLIRCFRGMSSSPDKQKVFIRLICSILDRYHFSEICYPNEPPLGAASETVVTELSAASRDYGTSVTDREIEACLSEVVFPKIQKLLSADSEKVNVNISLAALKVLKLLPADVMDLHLSSIIHRISNFLKHRLESVRDEARFALATCLKELGLEYLQFIVKVLQATLKRGFELHVLGYTVNFILSKCLLNSVNGKLDYCLGDLLCVIEMDILGDVAEEKDVDKIASKMKETKKKKSFETLKLVAQNITFKSHALKLLAPVLTHMQRNITPKVKANLETMLQHIAAGIECNPSVVETDLFIFIYGLVEDGIKDKIYQHENKLTNAVNKHSSCIDANKKSTGRGVEYGSLCSHLIIVFALRILHKHVKGMKQDVKDANILSLLDPFVRILSECLQSKYEDIVSASLGCLTVLVRLPLPSLRSEAEKLKASLLNIVHTTLNSSSPLMQSCLTLLTVLLRSTNITLTSDQLLLLVQHPLFVDLEKNQSPVALSLLKCIVMRKLEVHEIYDLMTTVSGLMVTSQLESIRKKCSTILLQFLLGYRLKRKLLQEHLNSLIAYLSYEYPTGRKSVLEMIHAIIVKFPRSVLDEQSQIFFVQLVLCLNNDSDDSVRSMSGAAIKELLASISPNSLNTLIEYTLTWYLGENHKFWAVAAQVLGMLIEVLKKGFDRHIDTILPVTRRILQSSIDVTIDRKVDSSQSIIPHWKGAYYSLAMLEKLIRQFNKLCFARDLEVIWDAICQMLLHPHSWIRNRSVHLIAQYFTLVVDAFKEHNQKSLASFYLASPSRLFHIAASLCCQLKTPLMDDTDTPHLMNQGIVFAICGVHSVMGHVAAVDPSAFWSSLEQHEKDRFLKAFDLLDSRKGRVLFLTNTSNVNEQNNQQGENNVQHILVSILLRKMGKIALQMETSQMGIVFDSFKSIMSQMSQEASLHYASEVLLPLYKVCEGFAGKVIPDDVKHLAEESVEKIQNIMGTQNFVQVYNLVGKKLKAKRDKKKEEEKVMAVINPMRNAKRKMRISAKHRAHKKRKMTSMKMARWMH